MKRIGYQTIGCQRCRTAACEVQQAYSIVAGRRRANLRIAVAGKRHSSRERSPPTPSLILLAVHVDRWMIPLCHATGATIVMSPTPYLWTLNSPLFLYHLQSTNLLRKGCGKDAKWMLFSMGFSEFSNRQGPIKTCREGLFIPHSGRSSVRLISANLSSRLSPQNYQAV